MVNIPISNNQTIKLLPFSKTWNSKNWKTNIQESIKQGNKLLSKFLRIACKQRKQNNSKYLIKLVNSKYNYQNSR